MLRISFFAGPTFELSGSVYGWSARPKVLPLLAHVLLRRDVTDRSTLAFTLWPDEDEPTARVNLRRHIHYLQEALPQAPAGRPWLVVDATRLRWNPNAEYSLDVADFDRLRADRGRLEEAAALYRGDLLPDLSEEWLIGERERLRTAHQDVLAELIAIARSRHDVAKGMDYARRLLAADPWREDAIRHIMALHVEAGNRAGALKEYERFANALSAELDAEPMEQTTALYNAIARGDQPAGAEEAGDDEAQRIVRPRPAAPFVGREDELATLRGAWQRAARGSGSLVLVGGEEGIGKSRLTREIAAHIAESGGRVFFGGTSRAESAPYQAPIEALRAAASLAPHLDIEPVWLAALAQLVPSLADGVELPQSADLAQDRQRTRLFEAYALYIQAVARRHPCCIVLEDLHWAGAATIDLIGYLARRSKRAAVLIVATNRDEDLEREHPLRDLRRAAQRDGYGTHVALGRLAFDAVRDLVRLSAPGDGADGLAKRLFERTEGTPLFAVSLLDELNEVSRDADGPAASATLENIDMPKDIRAAVNTRLARLSPGSRALADTASVAGRVFDVELLQEMTGLGEAVVLDGLGELIDRRIISERGGATRWQHAFAHDLIHLIVYEAIDGARRTAQHKRMARVMQALNANALDDVAAQIAHHCDRGADPAQAAIWFVRAARRATGLYANLEARAMLERALELSEDQQVRYEAYMLIETIADRLGNRDAQRRALDQLDELAPSQPGADAHAEVLYRRLLLAAVLADRAAHARLAERLDELSRQPGLERWRPHALASTASLACATGDYDGARGAIRELLAHEGDPAFAACTFEAWRISADVSCFQGRIEEAQHALDKATALAQSQADQSALGRLHLAVARAAIVKQNYPVMAAEAEHALRIARAIGDRAGEGMALHTLANGSVYPFRIADARRFYEEATAVYEAADYRANLAALLVDRGLFLTEIGLLDDGADLYKRADAAAAAIKYRWVLAVTAINSSYCERLRGDVGAATAAAHRAIAIAQELNSRHLQSAAFGNLGAAELAAGAVDDAIANLERGVELRRSDGPTPRLGDNLSHLAVAYARAGRTVEALSAAREVLAFYDAAPHMPPQPTEWLWNAAQAYTLCGDLETAKSLVNRGVVVARKRAALIADERIRRAFLSLPFNRAVHDAQRESSLRRR